MGNHQSEHEVSITTVHDHNSSRFHHNREYVFEDVDETKQTVIKNSKNSENISNSNYAVERNKHQLLKNEHPRRYSIPSIFLRLDAKLSAKNSNHKKGNDDENPAKCHQKNLLRSTKFTPLRRSSMAILQTETSKPPIIQINGVDEQTNASDKNFSLIHDQFDSQVESGRRVATDYVQKTRAQKMDSRKVTAQRRLERGSQHSQKRRLEYLGGTSSIVARSLDEASGSHTHFATDLQRAMMKPLNVLHKNSPLKQMRTYSHRSVASEENLLTKEDGAEIRKSWKLANERIQNFSTERCFGFYVLEKVLEKLPQMKDVFGVTDCTIYDVPDSHLFSRHTRIFTSIIDLAVRNVDELETEIAPALFTYGRRHYQQALLNVFDEQSVRMFCAEIVHIMVDLLGDNLTTLAFEAWIELVRYMGAALLSGFEYERLTNTKKISINTKQHTYFVL